MKKPTNTSEYARRNPLGVLGMAMMMGSGESIMHQEVEGQREFTNSDTLPTDIRGASNADLERLGLKLVGPVEGDPMFQYVTIPDGWKKQASDHSMWSHLLDNKGRVRVRIFYKAAFYDRSAHMSLERRFNVQQNYDRGEYCYDLADCGRAFQELPPFPVTAALQSWEVSERAYGAATEALSALHPNWKDVTAYWD